MIRTTQSQLRAIGTTHSFNEIADTDGVQLNMKFFNEIKVDKDSETVTFGAGVTLSMLIGMLESHEMAIPILPSLPHINVVGAVVTGTHGGSTTQKQLASLVTAMRLVDPDGNIKVLDKESPDFNHYLHAFGLLGVITEMTMKIEPEFAVLKCIYEDLSWDFL